MLINLVSGTSRLANNTQRFVRSISSRKSDDVPDRSTCEMLFLACLFAIGNLPQMSLQERVCKLIELPKKSVSEAFKLPYTWVFTGGASLMNYENDQLVTLYPATSKVTCCRRVDTPKIAPGLSFTRSPALGSGLRLWN